MKKESQFLWGMIFLGVALRTPFTTIPTVLGDIAQTFHVETASLGVLTSIPLIMFAVFSSLAPKFGEKFGLEVLFAGALLLMTGGSLLRILGLPMLYLGTLIIGICIAILNVLLPSLIQANEPRKIGYYTTVYTSSMGVSTALAAAVAVPISQVSGWQGLVVFLTGLLLLAFVVWLPNTRDNHLLAKRQTGGKGQSLMINKGVWALTIFGGLQSLLFYTGMTWLPTMAQEQGLSASQAGLLASLYTLIGLPFSMTVPGLTSRWNAKKRSLLVLFATGSGLLGLALLFFPSASFMHWFWIFLLMGMATATLFPYLLILFSLKTSRVEDTARLSGFAQTGGYLLAAFGPTLFGTIASMSGSWTLGLILLVLLTALMGAMALYVEKLDKIL